MGQYHTFDAAEYDHTKIWITDVTRTGNRAECRGTSTGNAKMKNGNKPNLNPIQ